MVYNAYVSVEVYQLATQGGLYTRTNAYEYNGLNKHDGTHTYTHTHTPTNALLKHPSG